MQSPQKPRNHLSLLRWLNRLSRLRLLKLPSLLSQPLRAFPVFRACLLCPPFQLLQQFLVFQQCPRSPRRRQLPEAT